MRHPAATGALALLVACAPAVAPDPDQAPAASWTERPNEAATHFRSWHGPDAEALLVLGPSADTLARLLITTADPAPAGPCGGAWTTLRPGDRGMVLLSTTHTAYIAALRAVPRVSACAWPDRQRDSTMRAALAAGATAGLAEGEGTRLEQLTALDPALVLHHPFGGGVDRLPPQHVAVPVCEYLEPHPLGRAEWLRFFGVLTGTVATADSLYAAIAARYRGAVRTAGPDAPLVFIGSAWRGVWSVPAGNSLMARLVADAGGRYRYADRIAGGNIDLPLEVVMADAHSCTHWGVLADVPALRTAADLPGVDARMLNSPAFRTGTVFVANSAEADLFGRAMLEPDVLLTDLQAALDPAGHPAHRPTYFRRLPQ
ncbi:MAG TPA: hypothetical protein PKE21_15685 [Flavobacteriales bacterium]|nr:hypothetical protein [Flavobacteriales bacterium]HMR28924.1 hypothetical protein [Flavobacteriales bacterium]